MKICCTCKILKNLSDFNKHKSNKDGLQIRCNSCRAKKYQSDRERILKKKYEREHADFEKTRKYNSDWRHKNREHVLNYSKVYNKKRAKQQAEYYLKNREYKLRIGSEWKKRNPEKSSATKAKRRRAFENTKIHYTGDDVRNLLKKQRCKCVACKVSFKKKKYHVDHITPVARGGDNSKYNIQLLCSTCNHQKHAKHPIDFMQEKGFLL